MSKELIIYSSILLVGVFVAAISQVMLKKASQKKYNNTIQEYMNPLVIIAYILFVGTTFVSIYAYKVVPLSMGPILEATSYIWITVFGVTIFREKMTKRKIVAMILIIIGIIIYGTLG